MLNFKEWLEDPTKVRGLLVEAGVLEFNPASSTWIHKTMYLSTMGYITEDSLTSYLPIIIGGGQFSESLSLDGALSISFGDIEIDNANGAYDNWLDSTKYVWVNSPIKVYFGDNNTSAASLLDIQTNVFEKVFDGVIADIDCRNRTSLTLKVRDKLERLNTPLTEHKLGLTYNGGLATELEQPSKDAIRPVVFGEVHNSTPLLKDPSTLEYIFNEGISEELIEVRDNGVPVIVGNKNLTLGTFKLLYPSKGSITASVQGTLNSVNISANGAFTSTYVNTVASLIASICMRYGNDISKLLPEDIDFNNLISFNSSNPQSVGIVISDRENVLNVCTLIANSVGAQLYFNRLGKLQLLKLGTYTSDASIAINNSDIVHGSLEISNRSQVVASTKVGYCKNWTVQAGLLTGIPMSHKTMYSEEWYSKTAVDEAIKTIYKLNAEPVQKDTLLLNGTEAADEALRLNEFYKVPRVTYRMTCAARLLNTKLGQQVTLTHNRFGLTSGKTGQVISVSPNWLNSTIDIEVLI